MPVKRPPRRARVPARVVLALLMCAGAALVFWRGHLQEASVQELAREAVPEPAPAPEARAPVIAEKVMATASAPRNPCAGDELSLTERGATRLVCVEAVDVNQNGSVRSYRASLGEPASRSLRIDAVGSRVLSASIEGGAGADLRCSEQACVGIRIGGRDVRGARIIHIDGLKLLPQFSVGAATEGGAQLEGQLRTPPEEQLASLACAHQGVTIVTSESSSTSFCPKGGAGFELAGDGTKSYKFTNLDGESIRVAVDGTERVRRVEYQAEALLACGSPACASVLISEPGPSGERTFTFSGTTLTEVNKAEINAVMSGTLVLPPL